jgi:predicted nucleic acid-binding protein
VPIETTTKVVDASAVVALVLGETGADRVASRLADAQLVAPTLLLFELANVFVLKIRRQPRDRDALIAGFRDAMQIDIGTRPIDYAGVLDLAEATGLTAYDASYLWLARALSAELVTLDGQLAKAANALAR